MDHVIDIKGLTVRYGSFTAVDSIDLTVSQGEVFGSLGPNGAGKTTTIRVLLNLLQASAGKVFVLGEDVARGQGQLRSRMGFLPGDLRLFPGLTGSETLTFFTGLQGRAPTSRDPVLDRLGFPRNALDRKLRSYSTGMRQMIGITAAFQHDPEVLVLDEPTTGLDPLVRDAFLGMLQEVAERGTTVFLSSHVLSEVETAADRVGLIDKGCLRLVESIEAMKKDRPRQVVLRYSDGREIHLKHTGTPAELLSELETEGLVDLEIRPTGLDDVVRAVLGKEATH